MYLFLCSSIGSADGIASESDWTFDWSNGQKTEKQTKPSNEKSPEYLVFQDIPGISRCQRAIKKIFLVFRRRDLNSRKAVKIINR